MKLQVLKNHVLIRKPIIKEEKTASGLVLPSGKKEEYKAGFIEELGPDVEIKVKVGDKVMCDDSYSKVQYEDEDNIYKVITEEDVLAIIT